MIFLTTNADGRNTEGIGAMVQYQMFCYCLSKHLGVDYVFSKFKNLQHWQYHYEDQQKFVNDVNVFFNIPSSKIESIESIEKISVQPNDKELADIINSSLNKNIIIDISPITLMQYGQSNIEVIEKNNWLRDLKSNISFDQKSIYENYDQYFNVAIHIRKFTKTDCDPSAIRDLYDVSKNQYYVNLIDDIIKKYQDKKLKIHIYSQGNDSDFFKLKRDNLVEFHVEEHPLTSLYHMINSDVFVMANSSLSYIVSLYRSGLTYKKNNFYHSTYLDTIRLSRTGNML